ncbi:interferon kappa [Tenrec ecaudatus]|uniref:interferon kappa n=1 Tax=Tenrec ecaudatus TaxID=94439 RepID=UPI003F59214A
MSATSDLIQKCVWPTCLVGLFITRILPLECDLLNAHSSRVTRQNLRLLNTLSNPFPVECLRERRAFTLPAEILSHTQLQRRHIKKVLYEIFIQIFNIFSQCNFTSVWEEKYVTQIQIGLYQQLDYLEECLEEEEKENEATKETEGDSNDSGAREALGVSNLKLRSYFNRIGNFLKDKKYSYCAWEIIRVEIRRCLFSFQKLTIRLRRK